MFKAANSQIDSQDNDLSELLLSIINRENIDQGDLKTFGKDIAHHMLDLPNALQLNNKTITRIRLICCVSSSSLHLILYTNSKEKQYYSITYEEYEQLIKIISPMGSFFENINSYDLPVLPLSHWRDHPYGSHTRLLYDQLHQRMLNLFLSTLPSDNTKPLTIIELGCGNARLLKACYVHAKERGYKVLAIGIDPNADPIKDYLEEGPANREFQLFQKPASFAPDILKSTCPDIHSGKVFFLLSGYLTERVTRGSKEALQLLTPIYPNIDVLIWGGATSPLLTKKSLTPNFSVSLDSYGKNIIYKLIKKPFEEKIRYYSEKLAHKNRLDLSHELTSVIDIIDVLSLQDKSKIESLILIDSNLQDLRELLDRLSQLKNIKEVYFELSQLKKLNTTSHFIDFFIENKIEIKLQNSHDKYKSTYLSVSEAEKISPQLIINFFKSPPNSLLNNSKTLIEHLNITRELLKRTHLCIDKSHKFYNEFMNLYGLLSDQKLDLDIKSSTNVVFLISAHCTDIIAPENFGNKYDKALFL